MNENSRIIISGNVYAPGDRYAISREDGPFYVYFDGVDFYLKHKMGCHRLELQVNSGSKDMLKESQFPYSLLINS